MPGGTEADLRQGRLAADGHYDDAALARAAEVIERVAAEGIETVRVVFPDQHGIFRGKTLTAHALPSAFKSGIGIPSTILLKDTSHKTVFQVWDGADVIGTLPLAGSNQVSE